MTMFNEIKKINELIADLNLRLSAIRRVAGANFIGLVDTPSTYVDQEGKGCFVKRTEDGIEFLRQIIVPKMIFSDDSQSSDINVHQGYTTDGTFHYLIHTNRIDKRNAAWGIVAQNLAPFAGLVGYDHIGDGDYYNGKLYITGEHWASCLDFSNQSIFVFDASDLSRLSVNDISAQAHEAAGCVVVPEHGTNGIIYVVSYCDGTKIWKYKLTDFSYLGAIDLDLELTSLQGITYRDGYFYVSENASDLYAIDINGHCILVIEEPTIGAHEGLDFSQDELRWLIDEGAVEKIHFFGFTWDYDNGVRLGRHGDIQRDIELERIACRIFLSSTWTGLGASATTRVDLDTLDFDIDLNWNAANFRYVIPRDGGYEITWHCTYTDIEDGGRYHCGIQKGGVPIADGGDVGPETVATNCLTVIASGTFELKKDDLITFVVWSNAAAGKRDVRGDADGIRTYASIVKVF